MDPFLGLWPAGLRLKAGFATGAFFCEGEECAVFAEANFLKRLFGSAGRRDKTRAAEVGAWGEACSVDYLISAGYTVLGRNVRPNRHDEIDIIARIGETLVFIEVKARKREDYGRPVRAVDRDKRHALNRAAAAYLRKAHFPDLFYRFDVIEVLGEPEEGTPQIRHLDNAFPFEKRFVFPV